MNKNNPSSFSSILRRLAGVSLVLVCAESFAVGLGDLNHSTYIGQKLDAYIKVIGAQSIAADNFAVRRVGQSEAESLGLELLYSPFTYKIDTIMSDGALSAIRVRSNTDIVEPYVNLVIELKWPTGSVIREYALLFDAPPHGSPSLLTQTTSGTSFYGEELSSDLRLGLASGSEYVVKPGDTLSGIASGIQRPLGFSKAAAMNAIFNSNPHAFQEGNINLLVAGARILLPGTELDQHSSELASFSAVSSKSASASSTRQSDANHANASGNRGEGRLTLSEPQRVAADAPQSYSEPQIRKEIDGTQEMIDLLIKENLELKERIENIESSDYLNTLNQLVSMQRRQIAELQQAFEQRSSELNPSAEADTNATSSAPGIGPASQTVERVSFAQALADNFWLFLALLALGFTLLAAVVYFAIRGLGANSSSPYVSTVAQKNKRSETLDPLEYDGEIEVSFELPSSLQSREKPDVDAETEAEAEQPLTERSNVSSLGAALEEKKRQGSLASRIEANIKENDHELKERIRKKTEEYNSTPVSSQAPSNINEVEIDVLVGVDEEVNELLSMAKIYCSAGKYSEAKAILSAQQDIQSDPRLSDALQQIAEMESTST